MSKEKSGKIETEGKSLFEVLKRISKADPDKVRERIESDKAKKKS